jgi:hypothetical protein
MVEGRWLRCQRRGILILACGVGSQLGMPTCLPAGWFDHFPALC